MQTPPPDLDGAELGALLERHWAMRPESLAYLRAGFGSHHWDARAAAGERRFVTVDRIEDNPRLGPTPEAALETLDRAFRTAVALRDEAGLEYVVAPLADDAGAVVHRLGAYAVSVFPFVEGQSSGFGAAPPEELLHALDRLHAASLPAGLARREDFAVPRREELLAALRDLDRPWASGPFAEDARSLLDGGAEHVQSLLREYDGLAARAHADANGWVVTHGEPHGGNVLRAPDGRLLLVDWDTVCVAPRERDLWLVLDEGETAGGDPDALRLYRIRWELADIAEFVALFRRPRERTADTAAACGYLGESLRPG